MTRVENTARTAPRLFTVTPEIQREPMNDSENIRILYELIDALDRRLPQIQRAGEASIAQDAAALKVNALERVARLEQRQTSV